MRRALVLFTRDLRVHDNAALAAALQAAEEIVPLFVLDEQLLGRPCGSPNRLAFLLDSLHDLGESLAARGAGLLVRHGDVVKETMSVCERWKAEAVFMTADVSAYARARERRMAGACEEERRELRLVGWPTVVEPGALIPTGGDHYRVFTPYWRVWSNQPLAPAAPTPRRVPTPDSLRASRIPALGRLTDGSASPARPAGGETRARARVKRWLGDGIDAYGSRHDDLPGAATSELSAHLHFGNLSARTVLERTRSRRGKGPADFARQLCWRDFHHQVLFARPDLPVADYRPRGDRWRRDRRGLAAWKAGLTGYPIVDAGMRQLSSEGYMHNRARLIVASFLTKLLYVDWREGAAHFATLLVDADVANNIGNWQWVAGTGNDTRPNRVLNPIRQAHRFDPQGDYVRRYVPELADVEGAGVHEPWRLPSARRRALDYPAPLLDHAEAARELARRRAAAG